MVKCCRGPAPAAFLNPERIFSASGKNNKNIWQGVWISYEDIGS